jgi:hypothetical protein
VAPATGSAGDVRVDPGVVVLADLATGHRGEQRADEHHESGDDSAGCDLVVGDRDTRQVDAVEDVVKHLLCKAQRPDWCKTISATAFQRNLDRRALTDWALLTPHRCMAEPFSFGDELVPFHSQLLGKFFLHNSCVTQP